MTGVGAVEGLAFLSFFGFLASRPPLSLLPMRVTLRRVVPSGQEALEGEFGEVVRTAVSREQSPLGARQMRA